MDKWLSNKYVIRIAAFFLAVLLYVVVHLDEQPPVTTQPTPTETSSQQQRWINDVQITPLGLDTGHSLIRSIEPKFVNIELHGDSADINRISRQNEQFQIAVDVSELTEGAHENLPLAALGFPDGVEVTIHPGTVNVYLEEIVRKEVPVEVEVVGEPADGYRAAQPIAHPNRVIIVVPQDEAEEITSVKAQVDITNASDKVITDQQLRAYNAAGDVLENIRISPTVVNVEVPITSPFKTIPLQLRMIGEPPDGFSIAEFRQNASEVTIYGAENVLKEFTIYRDIEVDLSRLTSSQSISVPVPVRNNLNQVYPTEILVEVKVEPSQTKLIEGVELILTGESQEAVTRIVEPENGRIDVLVEGAPSLLAEIEQQDIQAIVDVSNLPPGVHTKEIKLNLPQFIHYRGDTPLTAEIRIEQEQETLDQSESSVGG